MLVCLLSQPFPTLALPPSQVFDKVKDSVLVVHTLNPKGKVIAQGSGVLISSDRVATNCHVVEGGISYLVGRGNQLVTATIYAEDGDKDICLLIAKGIVGKPAETGKATSLKVGDPVYAVGAPQGLELSLSDGIVAQLRGGPPPLIQITAAISPGSSGGGLFDGEGRLVGLTTLYLEGGQSLNFAMPVEWVAGVKQGRKPTNGNGRQTEWLKRAIALEELKDWMGLLAWCRKWTTAEPKNSDAWFNLGVSYGHLNRYIDAITSYKKALRIDPQCFEAWINLGGAYEHLKRYDDEIEAFRQAIRVSSQNASAWYNLGIAYGNLNRTHDSLEAYRQAVSLEPTHAMAWYNLGNSYGVLQQYNNAIEAYQQAIIIDPLLHTALFKLGFTYLITGNRPAAIAIVNKLKEIDPEGANVLFGLIVPH